MRCRTRLESISERQRACCLSGEERQHDIGRPKKFRQPLPPIWIASDGIAADAPLQLVTAYESNPRRWTLRSWFDLYSGTRYRITTAMPGGGQGIAGVKSLGTVATTYPYHPEPKRCGPDGHPCRQRTEGVLIRRPVHAAGLVCIGKEAHRLEERDLVAALDELQSVHHDPRREPWTVSVLPKLRTLAAKPQDRNAITDATGLQTRALRDVLSDRSRPRPTARMALAALVQDASPDTDSSPERRCATCGQPIPSLSATSPGPRRRYCSDRCRKRAARKR